MEESRTSNANGSLVGLNPVEGPSGRFSPRRSSSTEPPRPKSLKKTLGTWLRRRKCNFLSHQNLSTTHPEDPDRPGSSQTRPDSSPTSMENPFKWWKKIHRRKPSRKPDIFKSRELPPIPPIPPPPSRNLDASDAEDDTLANLGIPLDEAIPGMAFIPDDYDDEDEERLRIKMEGVQNGDNIMDFSKSIESVKNYGWYWGPISGEAAERLLLNEPDGSFLVRDSSADHYIFSLTFKLNGTVRHVRIEHDQGNFSFGTFTKFKSNTIEDFIENAVEYSRSGRYLFFLHRRPVLGPMRVQLLHPVSRFKNYVQSLQHQCRFVILLHVPRDLLHRLPIPPKIQEYLNTPFYYSETVAEEEAAEN